MLDNCGKRSKSEIEYGGEIFRESTEEFCNSTSEARVPVPNNMERHSEESRQ